ncbi:hypothetical protein [Tenacibaculum amylolyticum]|uniref:hypothetical protein n=1 Tax=Tenacibaculum amylolyticum TaxID=104269 RepID=UPI0038949E3E
MKKITCLIVMVTTMFMANFKVVAQNTTNEALDLVISATDVIENSSEKATSALRTITVEFIFGQQPNTNGYLAVIRRELGTIEEYSDEVNQYAYVAERLSEADLDVSDIYNAASGIEGRGDFVENNSQALVAAINANNQAEATRLIRILNQDIETIVRLADLARERAEEIKALPQEFTIRMKLVDDGGNDIPADTLPAYFAQNLDTNTYYYPQDRRQVDLFTNIPEGEYLFGAMDGYFDGASSKIVTISKELVNANGEIIVTLNYWSE